MQAGAIREQETCRKFICALESETQGEDETNSKHCKSQKVNKFFLKFSYRQYKNSDLDLSWARVAAAKHKWLDQWCVDALLYKLEAGDGSMTFNTFHNRGINFGRLWHEWPTLLHVNKMFRAALLHPQRHLYTDIGMTGTHVHIANFLAKSVGLTFDSGLDYLSTRDLKHQPLLDQSIDKTHVKQLWLSYSNMGKLAGWQRELRRKASNQTAEIAIELKKRLSTISKEVGVIAQKVLMHEPWASRYKGTLHKGTWEQRAAAKRSAWNGVMSSLEADIMKELESVVHRTTSAKVAMPSYDGLHVKHDSGALDFNALQLAWEQHSNNKWSYVFPVQAKAFSEHLPLWLPPMMELDEEAASLRAEVAQLRSQVAQS